MAFGKGDSLGPYKLVENFRVAGGRSRISFAEKDGKRWFVKEFLSPKYPTPESPGSKKTKEYKKKMCDEFEAHQRKIMKVTNDACSSGSNLVCAKDLIRHGASYYKISECVDTATMDPKDVAALDYKEVIIVLRSLASSLRILHNNNIVHGDLKPENILIKKTATGLYTTKLIDFDDSYFDSEPAEDRQSVVGTPEYYSPEVYNYISDEDEEIPGSTLTRKSDIYTLGIIFCEYLSGSRPVIDKTKFTYTYAATNADESVDIPYCKYITEGMKALLLSMLDKDPAKRPTIAQVFDELKKIDVNEKPVPAKKGSVVTPMEHSSEESTPVETKEDHSLPISFPRLKLPKALVDLLHGDGKAKTAETPVSSTEKKPSLKTSTSSKPSTTKKEESVEPSKPTLKIKTSTAESKSVYAPSSEPTAKPKLKGTLIK